ncbi:MAG: hypothetical protein AAF485_24405, partial [Chloroflexota bacterium]
DELNASNEMLYAVFKSPDSCQLAYGGETRIEDDGHWYGLWIFLRYISEHHGHNAVRAIWEQTVNLDGYDAVEAALAGAGTNLTDIYQGYTVALLTRNFEEGAAYPTVRLEGEILTPQTFTPTDGVGQMGSDYIELKTTGLTAVRLNAPTLSGLLIGVRNGQATIFPLSEQQATVDTSAFDHLYLAVMNLNRATDEYACQMTSYTVDVTTGTQAQAADQTLPVPNFLPPSVEPLMAVDAYGCGDYLDEDAYFEDEFSEDPYGDFEEGDSLTDDSLDDFGQAFDDCDDHFGEEFFGNPLSEAPAHLVPGYLPIGYTLDGAFELAKAEFGHPDEAIFFVPGEGPATVLDFFNTGDGFVSVIASPSPYSALAEWAAAADIEYAASDLTTIQGVKVLIEDWSDGDIYSSATLIDNDQFIVIDGTISTTEMLSVAESLIK